MKNQRYILLDAARMGDNMEKAKELNPEFDSLYRGRDEEPLASVAPYLFTFDPKTDFAKWYFKNGWGDSWGIIVISQADNKPLYKHFRRFLMVKTEDKQELYFRFYDPRVLRIFLPTCDKKQLRDFFSPIDYFICEDENPDYGLVFSFADKKLNTKKLTKEQVIVFWQKMKS